MRIAAIRERLIVVGAIRIVLGAVWVGAARAAGAATGVALLGFAFGTIGLTLAALADPRHRFLATQREPESAPADAVCDSWLRLAWDAVFPSTVGVSVLAGVALFRSTALAAILAGALAGMGFAALVSAVRVAVREGQEGGRLYEERGSGRLVRR